jgi:hypothetical protein
MLAGRSSMEFFWDSMVTSVIALSALLALSFAWNQVSDADMYTEKKLPVINYIVDHVID